MLLDSKIERFPQETAVITFQGSLTLGTSLKFADSQLQSVIADGVNRMIIDLSGVDFLDSAGLGMLVYIYGALNEKNGVLRLCGVTPRVQSVFKLTRTDAFLLMDTCRDDSLAALN